MIHSFMMSSLLILAGIFSYRAYVVSGLVTQGHNQETEWRRSLCFAGVMMIACLLCNAMAYCKTALIGWHISESANPWALLRIQSSVLLGTSALMWLVIQSLAEPSVLAEPTPELGMSRTLTVIVEKLLPRFWRAALGFGVVFGVADQGTTLLLAVELAISWGLGRILLNYKRRQHTIDQR